MINIICSWWGDSYSYRYVDNLFESVSKNFKQNFTFFCQTDNDYSKLNSHIEIIPISNPFKPLGYVNYKQTKYWDRPKLNYWKPRLGYDISGLKIALDIDIIIQKDFSNITDLYNDKPITIRSFWRDDKLEYSNMWTTKNMYRAYTNGGFFMWDDSNITKKIYDETLNEWERISFVFKTMDNHISHLYYDDFDYLPSKYVYSFNNGHYYPNDIDPYIYRDMHFCLFNTDTNSHNKQLELHEAYIECDWIKKYWTYYD